MHWVIISHYLIYLFTHGLPDGVLFKKVVDLRLIKNSKKFINGLKIFNQEILSKLHDKQINFIYLVTAHI